MTAAMPLGDVLVACRSRRLGLRVRDGQIHARGPKGALTPELRAGIETHKPVLLNLLSDVASFHDGSTAAKFACLYADLSDGERLRLLAEAARGDRLAGLIVLAVKAS